MVRPVGLWMAIALGLSACGSASEAVPMTRDRCEAQPGFVFVPGGEFIAGSDQTERDYGYAISAQAIADSPAEIAAAAQRLRDRRWFELEGDRRRESLAAFCLQTHLVTQQDYAEFVTATAHRSPGITAEEYQTQGFLVHPYADVVPYLWREGQFPEGLGEHPVVLVSYDDALAYAQWRGEQDGGVYRLPTAAEWEKKPPAPTMVATFPGGTNGRTTPPTGRSRLLTAPVRSPVIPAAAVPTEQRTWREMCLSTLRPYGIGRRSPSP